jgi:hypothetical protein
MEVKAALPKPEDQATVGFSDTVSEVPESLLAIMKSNSYELDKMMCEITKQSIC